MCERTFSYFLGMNCEAEREKMRLVGPQVRIPFGRLIMPGEIFGFFRIGRSEGLRLVEARAPNAGRIEQRLSGGAYRRRGTGEGAILADEGWCSGCVPPSLKQGIIRDCNQLSKFLISIPLKNSPGWTPRLFAMRYRLRRVGATSPFSIRTYERTLIDSPATSSWLRALSFRNCLILEDTRTMNSSTEETGFCPFFTC